MSTYNYATIVPRVRAKIKAYGRAVTFSKRSITSAPSNDPLAGPQGGDIISTSVDAVFVPITGLASLGIATTKIDAFKTSEQVALLPPAAFDYAEQQFLIDSDGSVWKINIIDMLKPAETALLFYIGVSRP